jgi:hypothetical protein
MRSLSRRHFLEDASKTGIALSANLAFGGHMFGRFGFMPTLAAR